MSAKEYNPTEVENLIQESWKQDNSYKASPSETKEKFYCLSMFPYPSGNYTWVMFAIIRLEM